MSIPNGTHPKPVSGREWYDFVGQLAMLIPDIHPGGRSATSMLLDMCSLDATSEVLDVGCGSGSTACLIVEKYGSRVLGIDLSGVMVSEAKERARKKGLDGRAEFAVADVSRLALEDESFDVAIFQSVLVPMEGDKSSALTETARVIRPGGRIAANEGTVDPSAPPEFLELLQRHPAIHGHFTPGELRKLIEDCGLEVLEMRDFRSTDMREPRGRMSLGSLLTFLVRVYPKMLLRLVRDPRLREASRIDGKVTKLGKRYTGYSLIVGQKATL